ncbi:unnamed protein product, partial [Vitis vinifera]
MHTFLFMFFCELSSSLKMALRARPVTSKQPSESEETLKITQTSSSDDEEVSDLPKPYSSLSPPPSPSSSAPSTLRQRALSQTLASTANLANLLPTGTLLAFQLLTPVFTNNGACDAVTRFTDSFKTPDGRVFYGIATFKGLWLFDYVDESGSAASLPDLSKYKFRFIDGVHAVLSVLVFVAVAMRDKNVVSCFYPQPAREVQEVLDIVPVGIGLICSLLFVVFPTTRHGIGYPVTHAK